jgi:hypothetical protein
MENSKPFGQNLDLFRSEASNDLPCIFIQHVYVLKSSTKARSMTEALAANLARTKIDVAAQNA